MKWLKNFGDIPFVICTVLYYLTRQENDSTLQNITDILIIVALVLIVVNKILGRVAK